MAERTGLHFDTPLKFVRSEERFSVYLEDGEEVYLANGTGERLVDFDSIDINFEWVKFSSRHHWDGQEEFLKHLRTITYEPDRVDEVVFCDNCNEPASKEEDLSSTGEDTQVCESCLYYMYECAMCEQRFSETITTLDDDEVCLGCRSNWFGYCDECEGYYHLDYEDDHDHRYGCDCESPQQVFTVRNDGLDPLPNDTETTVALPVGVVSTEGLDTIREYLRTYARYSIDDPERRAKMRSLSMDLEALGDRWQTKEGNFTKRLSRHAYKKHHLKVPPDVISHVGVIAREHSTGHDYTVAVTRDLNLPPEEFCHEDSCWWGSYHESRCALKSNGGFGIRSFVNGNPTGRAWVMPLKKNDQGGLTPTFQSLKPDAFVVFNGYGDLSGYTAARIVAHMSGLTYRKIQFTCTPMYVNGSSGYLVAPEEIAEDYTDKYLNLYVETHSDLHYTESKELANA